MKTGILGGTFDPIHYAHLLIAETAADRFGLDRVLLMPSHISYFKEGRADGVSSPEDRLAMTEAAASDNPRFLVSDMEILRGGKSYTYETLEEMHREDPEEEIFYIVGADTVCTMGTWRYPERIFPHCTIVGALRPDQISRSELERAAEELRAAYDAKVEIMEIPAVGISSTDIRGRVREGRSIRYLVPEGVRRYIIDKGLYRHLPGEKHEDEDT